MKAVGYTEQLPIDNEQALIDLTLPKPEPTGRDLLVRVQAVSVNPRDIKSRQVFSASPAEPRVLGYDAAGVVEAVGPQVSLFQPGDPVFYAGELQRQGSNAEWQLVDERIVGHRPRSLAPAAAASVPLVMLTAFEMLFDRLGMPQQSTERAPTLLVLGGAGGVPSAAIQLARQAGAQVIATASRAESAQWVRDMGAHHVIDHSKPLVAQILELGIGLVDFAFSTHTTAEAWAALAEIMAPQGRLGIIDDPEPVDLRLFKAKSISIHWESMFTRSMFQTADMQRQHEILNRIADLLDQGQLQPLDKQHLGLINAANLRQAHQLIEGGHTIGKIVLEGF
ncbi:zinc-binding alcohol dehydrogenase [Pseudomonas saudimassiliensis]|uniref:Zinc-type alcohol dehydrogenase-like protein n=1 Tax=Pseudomonas saudimassiliensis TaxID=1461581 RepID=A0A078MF08_9PSED|nr:zinc-binding alcohol dehydrogenase family protein [Pseudomonas saudimassiliensis]CEA04864.1 zinc-binding alcohol dehydrogenase [Pseudomonas saudimassiliensis]CEF26835.1 zinc-binding alcohol dehydrogenase [Pseudomonas saudimassiliensis]